LKTGRQRLLDMGFSVSFREPVSLGLGIQLRAEHKAKGLTMIRESLQLRLEHGFNEALWDAAWADMADEADAHFAADTVKLDNRVFSA
jgi:hypothetical protein